MPHSEAPASINLKVDAGEYKDVQVTARFNHWQEAINELVQIVAALEEKGLRPSAGRGGGGGFKNGKVATIGPDCPDHGAMSPSKFGGFYCTAFDGFLEDGKKNYCGKKAK